MKYLNQSNRIFEELFYASRKETTILHGTNMATPMKTCELCDKNVTNSKLYRKLESLRCEKWRDNQNNAFQLAFMFILLSNAVRTSNLMGRCSVKKTNGTNKNL